MHAAVHETGCFSCVPDSALMSLGCDFFETSCPYSNSTNRNAPNLPVAELETRSRA